MSSETRQSKVSKPPVTKTAYEERPVPHSRAPPAQLAKTVGRDAPRSARPRSSLKIHLDILETIRDEGPSKPTRIVLAANLSHDRLVRYLADLVSQGLLQEHRGATARFYALTAKGLEFINQIRETEAFLAGFGLEM